MVDAAGGILDREAQIGLGVYFRRVEFDYAGGSNIVYIGKHFDPKAVTSDNGWVITKFSYSGSDVTGFDILTGIYDNRATLDWPA